jgi:two-component system CheB/CheR fusion protein
MIPPQPAGPLCVLAVDDNHDAADAFFQLVGAWGHRPLVAYSGATALDLALRERPDVVVLDLGMPGMDGWELARRLRAEPALNGLVLIAVTGYGQDGDRIKSDAAGINYHLLKPVDPDLLRDLLAAYACRKT